MIGAPLTCCVGRAAETDECVRVLRSQRLVTLTGPGGIGKTRLAEQVRARVADDFGGAVTVVSLAELEDPTFVTTAIAHALGLHDAEVRTGLDTILHYLRARAHLLVLDNCEHLSDDLAEVVLAVLAECPQVRVLTTSRKPLGVMSEHLLPVPPLRVPPAEPLDETSDHSPADLLEYDAVRLLAERARAVAPNFAVTADNASSVVRLSRQLDGHPLAIELAAGRLRSLDPDQLADRLEADLHVLATEVRDLPLRHRSLHAALGSTLAHCSPAERAAWSALAVFVGSFDLVGAEHVCQAIGIPRDQVLAIIDALLANSALVREPDSDGARYRFLEPLREFGSELLEDQATRDAVTNALRDHVAALLQRADAEWFSPAQQGWTRRLEVELPTIRSVLDRSMQHPEDAARALDMARHASTFLVTSGRPREGRIWLDRALAASRPEAKGRDRAAAAAALCALFHADIDGAEARIAELVDRDGGDARGAFLHTRAFIEILRVGKALELAEAAGAAYEDEGQVGASIHPRCLHAVAAAYRGDLAQGRAVLHRTTAIAEQAGSLQHLAMALFFTGVLEIWLGDPDAGEVAAKRALRLHIEAGYVLEQAYGIEVLAWLASRREDHVRAAVLFGAADARWERCGSTAKVAAGVAHETFAAQTAGALGQARFTAAAQRGRDMDDDTAWAFVFSAAGSTAAQVDPLTPLTRREAEIAALVADGLSNPAIAERLVIARRTVDTHVGNILTKLDFNSRSQIARWITERASTIDDQ